MFEIESPCVSVCKMNPETDLCIGCWRTREEIKGWKEADQDTRLEILEQLHQRREAAGGGKRRRPSRRRATSA